MLQAMLLSRALKAAVLLAGAFAALPAAAQGARPPTPVEVARVERETTRDTLEVVGTLRAAESVTIRPELPGRIVEIGFDEGGRVEKGAMLFRLDDALVRAELNEAQANLARSQRASERGEELAERRLIPAADLDEVRADLAVDRARSASARTRLQKMTIRAPFAGSVGLRQVSVGEYVGTGEALVRLVRSDPIEVEFSVPEAQVGRLQTGQPVTLRVDARGEQSFEGEVSAIAPTIDAAGRSVTVRARLANPDNLLVPGQFARVSLALGGGNGALTIPEQALWPVGENVFVFRVEEGVAKQVEVATGARQPGRVRVLSGLSEGDLVVTAGQMKIGDGTPVMPLEPTAGAAQ